MDSELTIKIAGLIIGGLGTIGVALLVWGLKALIQSVISTRDQLILVNEKVANLVEDTKSIPKLKEDINAFHAWKRNVTEEK